MTYEIHSIKHSVHFSGELDAAIELAIAIDEEYQPAFGVQVESNGDTVYDTEDENRGE